MTATWYQIRYSNGDRNMLSPNRLAQTYEALTCRLSRLYKQDIDLETGKFIGPMTEVEVDYRLKDKVITAYNAWLEVEMEKRAAQRARQRAK